MRSKNALAALALFASTSIAQAVITNGAALDRPDDTFVGVFRGGSAVAIGENYLLTAAHVGGRSGNNVFLNGERYRVTDYIEHPDADLALIEVNRELPGFHSITQDVSRGDHLVFGGYGVTEARDFRGGSVWSNRRGEVWGENELAFTFGGYGVFDYDGGRSALESEAIFTPGDSGTGVFVEQEDGSLAVAGIAVAITGQRGITRFGNLGIFELLDDRIDFFGVSFDLFDGGEILRDGGFTRAVPTPATIVLLVGAAVVPMRRRR